jgi:hypothetical protein
MKLILLELNQMQTLSKDMSRAGQWFDGNKNELSVTEPQNYYEDPVSPSSSARTKVPTPPTVSSDPISVSNGDLRTEKVRVIVGRRPIHV